MMKRLNTLSLIVIVLLCFFYNNTITAQQLPLFNQNRENLNPAFISSDYFKYDLPSSVSVRYRDQWVGIKGSPRTITGTYTNYNEDNNFLFGGDLIHDETGPTGFTGIYGRAGYAIELNNDFLLTAGLKGGVVQYRVKGMELHLLEPGDIGNENLTKIYPDLSLGAMLYYDKHYYLGFSVPQIIGLDLEYKDDIGDYNIQRVQHYYGIIGGRFDLSGDSWIEVSSEARYVQNVPFYINGTAEVQYRGMFYIKAGGSSAHEAIFGAGFLSYLGMDSNLLRVGYTFSNFFQEYGSHFGTVHELSASYSF
ncbi:MAG: PorP/SprF family type IX secretion system membrane protein [Saprospiraceae bacterium]